MHVQVVINLAIILLDTGAKHSNWLIFVPDIQTGVCLLVIFELTISFSCLDFESGV